MKIRKIVEFIDEKCTGCGQCIPSCHEGAIQIIDGKAKLIADHLCDGLGNCLGDCPFDAINIVEREAPEFDQHAVEVHLAQQKKTYSCTSEQLSTYDAKQWPIQLHLVPVTAEYFQNADLLLSATCASVSCPTYHQHILKNKAIVVACPKLDQTAPYITKLAAMIKTNSFRSITIAKMEVPCCSGLNRMLEEAILLAGEKIAIHEIVIDIKGNILT